MLCDEGHIFLRLCKKRNKCATLHLLDVLVTQHAKWTAKRVRRGLFGQSLVDFSADSWSSIHLRESAKSIASQSVTKQAKKTPRMLRSSAQGRTQDKYQRQDVGCTKTDDNDTVAEQTLVPGMSLYNFSRVLAAESQAVGDEEPMIFDS